MTAAPEQLRERIAADYRPVQALRSPWTRALAIVPLAIVSLVAAPVVFNVRSDAAALGWFGVWGFSLAQGIAGIFVIGAALRESIPGRDWSGPAIALWLAAPILAVLGITVASWEASQVLLRAGWWLVAGLCFAGSAAAALPIVALASVLAARAYPLRPAVAGALIGLGAGLVADAGWRTFCHFSEPSHVLSAHLAAVLMSTAIGVLAAVRLCNRSGSPGPLVGITP
jgi:hypothetical protein